MLSCLPWFSFSSTMYSDTGLGLNGIGRLNRLALRRFGHGGGRRQGGAGACARRVLEGCEPHQQPLRQRTAAERAARRGTATAGGGCRRGARRR
jgi:hypothetical protein